MFRSLGLVLFLAIGFVLSISFQDARADKNDRHDKAEKDWVKLGERNVSRDGDRDDLNVDSSIDYSKIKFRVEGPKVHFNRCKVHYRNGGTQEIEIDKNVSDGEGTGALDLNGKERHIKHVTIWYKTVGEHKRGQATVSIWALK